MKKKIFKSLAVVACALLLVVGSVVGTFAYLTSTAEVTNTFTVGNVKITMDEAVVDVYGVKTSGRTEDGNKYKLLPGHTYVKDPVIHVAKGSEECWLFVKIDNQLSDIQTNTTISDQLTANGWTKLKDNIWYHAVVDARTIQTDTYDVEVFESFTISDTADVNVDADDNGIADYAEKQIVVTAYAVQADGFGTAEAAWTAANFS